MSYCVDCGSPIPDGQGKVCSMCYGDIDYGRDGYYREFMEEQQLEEDMRGETDERNFEEAQVEEM